MLRALNYFCFELQMVKGAKITLLLLRKLISSRGSKIREWLKLVRDLVEVIAWFVVIFGINTTSEISKLLYVISRAVRRGKFETILKYHKWYLCQISRTNHSMILFVYATTLGRFVIFTCRYFKLSWNTTALSQSNCRNLLCNSINDKNTLNGLRLSIWRLWLLRGDVCLDIK